VLPVGREKNEQCFSPRDERGAVIEGCSIVMTNEDITAKSTAG
jgi:hypothetical protein